MTSSDFRKLVRNQEILNKAETTQRKNFATDIYATVSGIDGLTKGGYTVSVVNSGLAVDVYIESGGLLTSRTVRFTIWATRNHRSEPWKFKVEQKTFNELKDAYFYLAEKIGNYIHN